MGLAIGAGFFECVLLGAILIFISMRILPAAENLIIEQAPFLNIYVEFSSLDDIGCIIGHIKKQDVRILDVEIDHGQGGRLRQSQRRVFPPAGQPPPPCGDAGVSGRAGLRICR